MSQGKTVAIILAVCAGGGVLLLGLCGGLIYLGYKNSDAAVSPQIDALFAAIEQDKFADTYETHTTAELQAAASKQQYAAIGQAISTRLGSLKSKSMQSFNMQQQNADSFIDVTYDATFEKGEGTIVAKLRKQDGDWKFVNFRVNSPLFEQDLAAAKCPQCGAVHAANARFCPECGADLSGSEAEDTATDPASVERSETAEPQ